MPPLRRSGCVKVSSPYGKNCLRSRTRRGRIRDEVDDPDSNGTSLPDDVLSAVFVRFADKADVVRCASTCRRWGRVVAKEAAILSYGLPPLPRLALGFFHAEQRVRVPTSNRPCFVPMPSGTRLFGFSKPLFSPLPEAAHGPGAHGLFEQARPVASRLGRLILELRREVRANGINLCVCNPMTGDTALLPRLSGDNHPGFYACTLLCGDDLDPPRLSRTFFIVLIVYNRRRYTALRSYSSDKGCWSREVKRPGPRIRDTKLRKFGQGLVLRGVAYWPLMRTVLAVRLDTPEPTEVSMPPAGDLSDRPQNYRLLGATPDGKLTFIRAGVFTDRLLCMAIKVLEITGDDMRSGRWEKKDVFVLTQFKITFGSTVNLRWFCEKSGILIFTLGHGSNHPGTFALNVETHEIEKVAAGVHCNSWENFVGYEMEGASYLASIACP